MVAIYYYYSRGKGDGGSRGAASQTAKISWEDKGKFSDVSKMGQWYKEVEGCFRE
jgi:hypothetical protein